MTTVIVSDHERETRAEPTRSHLRDAAPGLALSLLAAALACGVAVLLPAVSPLLVAIALGMVVAAVAPPSARFAPGIALSARRLLRVGIVLLGLQVSLGQIVALGADTLLLVVVVVASGIAVTMAVGRRLGMSWTQRLLIACGFSICGAAAVAGVEGAADATEEETATAVALVVVFGTAMIGVVPLLASVLGLDDATAGVWAGASVHEVAQVVAVGGLVGGPALAIAVVVKLARVLMLAPVTAWVSWRRRSRMRGTDVSAPMPPIVPLFVVGFLAMVVVRSVAQPSEVVLHWARTAQTVLLSASMFALGCGVRIRELRRAGTAPTLLAALATMWVGGVGLVGSVLVS